MVSDGSFMLHNVYVWWMTKHGHLDFNSDVNDRGFSCDEGGLYRFKLKVNEQCGEIQISFLVSKIQYPIWIWQ